MQPLDEHQVFSGRFLDDASEDAETDKDTEKREGSPFKNPTQIFLEKCGGWKDALSPEEIIAEIYASRTTSERGTQLFQEDA